MSDTDGSGVVMLSAVRRGVPILWNEAVAVVAGIADWAAQASEGNQIPDIDHVGLSPAGEVIVFSGGRREPDPVKALASLLLDVIGDNPAPSGLLELARPRAAGTVKEPLEAFASELRFFQRPDPRQEVQALAARIEAHASHQESDRYLAEVADKVREENRKAAERQIDPGAKRRAEQRKRQVLVATGALAIIGALAAGAYYLRHDLQRLLTWRAPTVVSEEASDAQRAPAAARKSRSGPPASQAGDTSAPAEPGEGFEPAPRTLDNAFPEVGTSPDNGAPETEGLQPSFATLDFASPADPKGTETRAEGATSGVYSAEDADVEPPVLVKPRLPSQPPPGIPEDQIGVIELLINEDGTVERVRLISPSNRFSERMLLSAAKAWIFEPARRDGRPVKYLTRVRVTI